MQSKQYTAQVFSTARAKRVLFRVSSAAVGLTVLALTWGHFAAAQGIPSSQPGFGADTCSGGLYLGYVPTGNTRTDLTQISLATNPFTYTLLGTTTDANTLSYNGLAYRKSDGYLYAIAVNKVVASTTMDVLRVGSDGSTVSLGAPTVATPGSPALGSLATGGATNGTIGADGYFYIRVAANPGVLRRIDLNTMQLVDIPLTTGTAYGTSDFAWMGDASTGMIYAVSSGQLISIDPRTGFVTAIGAPSTVRNYGAVFSAQNGLFVNDNAGGLYQVNLTTGETLLLGASPASGNSDGASCPDGKVTFGADLSVTKTNNATTYQPGSIVTYQIVASNAGPFSAVDAQVNDPLPSGITTASWTCAATVPASGATCASANGAGAITDVLVNLPKDKSVTFTVNLTIPPGRSGNLVNVVEVAPGPTNVDTKLENNTATDNDALDPLFAVGPAGLAQVPALDNAALLALISLMLTAKALTAHRQPLRFIRRP